MKRTNAPSDYSIAQKCLHWIIGLAIMADLFIAQKFGREMVDIDRFESRNDHATLGTLVAAFFAIRLYLRFKRGAPALPSDLPSWQLTAATMAHRALYALIGIIILTGIGSAISANSAVSPFGLFSYGDGQGTDCRG